MQVNDGGLASNYTIHLLTQLLAMLPFPSPPTLHNTLLPISHCNEHSRLQIPTAVFPNTFPFKYRFKHSNFAFVYWIKAGAMASGTNSMVAGVSLMQCCGGFVWHFSKHISDKHVLGSLLNKPEVALSSVWEVCHQTAETGSSRWWWRGMCGGALVAS